jgi:predicted PurR-regulated permease PerM
LDNKYLPESGYKRIAVISFYVIAVAAAAYVIFKYLVGLFLPFIIAWFAALLLQPLISYLSRRFRLPNKTVSVVVVLAVFALVGTLLFALSDRLIWECGRLFEWLNDNADIIIGQISGLLENLTERIPIAGTVINNEYITTAVSDMIRGALTSISSRVPDFIAAAVGVLPRLLFFIVIL